MRHWIHGGRTDLDNLVLLCDVDHGLAHDLELIMSRRAGRRVVTAPDGGRVWGSADVVIAAGIGSGDDGTESFAGVRAIDEQSGRRPLAPSTGWSSRPSRVGAHIGRPEPAEPLRTADPEAVDDLTRLLFPDAVPTLPDAMHVNGERIDLAYAVGVLMGNRDLERRLRAEARGHLITAV